MKWNKNSQWVVVGITCFVTANVTLAADKRIKNPSYLLAVAPKSNNALSSTASSGSLGTSIKTKPFSPSFTGMLDLRAGYFSKSGKYDTENAAELGYLLTPKIKFSYLQAFNTSIYNSPDTTNGESVVLDAGHLKGKFNDLWQSEDKQTSFSFEQRIYLTNAFFQKDIDLITVSRSYFKLSQKLNETVKLTLMEVPILFVNGSPGVKEAANPTFENRVYFVTDISLTKNLGLSLPVIFHQTRFLNYKEGARNNNSWAYVLWVNPEIDYTINENVMIGFSYSNWSNLVASDLSKTNFANGFEDGLYQAIVTFSF